MKKSTSHSQEPRLKRKKRAEVSEIDLYQVSPQWYTPRSFIKTGYQAWRTCRQLENLTPLEFRDHLGKELKDLGLSKEACCSYLNILSDPPLEDPFWKILQDMAQDFRLAEETRHWLDYLASKYSPSEDSWFWRFRQHLFTVNVIPWQELPKNSWAWQNRQDLLAPTDTRWDKGFSKAFAAKYSKEPPSVWAKAASKVMVVLHFIWRQVQDWCIRRSQHLQQLWGQGKKQGLLTAVQEGLIAEQWVAQALLDLNTQTDAVDYRDVRVIVPKLQNKPSFQNLL